jgi:hypothetical protein
MFEKERGVIPVPLSSLAVASKLAHRPFAMLTGVNKLIAQKG